MLRKEPGKLQETAREKSAPAMQTEGDGPVGIPPPTSAAGDEASISAAMADRLADTMFALSTPSRVLILGSLFDGPHSVSDLTEALGMEQSAVSHQLRVLREHQLVRADRIGRRRLYALYDDDVRTLLHAGLHHVARDRPVGEEATSPRRAAKGAS